VQRECLRLTKAARQSDCRQPLPYLITEGLPVIRSQSSEDDALRQVLKCMESGSGTIIREWHPWGKVPGRFGRRKMLTRFLR